MYRKYLLADIKLHIYLLMWKKKILPQKVKFLIQKRMRKKNLQINVSCLIVMQFAHKTIFQFSSLNTNQNKIRKHE